MRRIRTFLAVELAPPVLKQALGLIRRLSAIDSGVRWVEEPQMHITLQFLGDVEELEIAEICSRTIAAVGKLPAFSIEVQGVGAFPNLDRPRTLWAGVTTGLEPMRELQQAVERSLNEMRFPLEQRQYRPHLTLGRVRNNRGLDQLRAELTAAAEFNFGPSIVEEVIVFSSERTAAGPLYTRMGSAELA